MKKIIVVGLWTAFLGVLTVGVAQQNQGHQHNKPGLDRFEERLIRYKEREYWQMPQRVLNELGIGPGMAVADVGAEIGYFTLPLSERVGKTGKVYASDIDENALAFLAGRLKDAGRDNVVVIHGRPDNPLIAKASVDLVLMVNTIHLVEEKTLFLDNLRDCLRENGKLVFVQWDAEKMDSEARGWDPQDRERYTMRTMLKMIYDANYEVLEIKDFLPVQLIYVCRPADR